MPDGGDAAGTDARSCGTYSLLIALPEPIEIEVGALGELAFEAGSYVYTGSAFGPGGFARIERHREIATGEREVRHWHVDSLLGHPDATIEAVWVSPDVDRECEIARTLPGEPVPDFGASDCDCESHLIAVPAASSNHAQSAADVLTRLYNRRREPEQTRD